MNTAEIGTGKAWALVTAHEVAALPPTQGLQACGAHAEQAAKIWAQGYLGHASTQLVTCERFADSTCKIIEDWQSSQALPMPHEDFAAGTSGLRWKARSFDPESPGLKTVAQHLRVVRLAVPELLRQKPTKAAVRQPLGMILKQLVDIRPADSLVPSPSSNGPLRAETSELDSRRYF